MKEIYSVTRISSEDFANRCGKEVTEYFDNILKELSKSYNKIIEVKGLHYSSKYIQYFAGFHVTPKLSLEQSVTISHELGGTIRVNFYTYILRNRITVTQIRKYYETFGIILDEDLRDLKIII
jgi:hypothetical protein